MAITRKERLTESEQWEAVKRAALAVQLDVNYDLEDLREVDEESFLAGQITMQKCFDGIRSAIVGAGLVRPFNWNAWGVPNPELDDVAALSEEDVWKFITRTFRADRFAEGNFNNACRSGHMAAFALRAYHHAVLDNEGWPKALPVDDAGVFEEGLVAVGKARLVRGRAGHVRTACPDATCPGWLVEMRWTKYPARFVCSSRLHYDWDKKEFRIVGGGMTSGLSHAQIEERKES